MKSSTLLKTLRDHSGYHIRFLLPDGGLIPLHAHVTEVGRVDKTFLDCGGTMRRTSSLCLQTWVADDVDHRLPAGKLADIIDRAAQRGDTILFTLGTKHTDCLAKEICLPNPQESSSCCSGTGCC
jgi:Family of unknown function (DUF6428)